MHYRFIRDSFWGRLFYHLSGHKLFAHKEDLEDYVIPEKYLNLSKRSSITSRDTLKGKGNDALQELKREEFIESSSNASIPNPNLIVVDWDGQDDPENPQNWPVYQKIFFIFEICLLTTSVYMGAGMYTPGTDEMMNEWNISRVAAILPLTLFVFGYGIGPMILSPMSENSIFGRSSIYVVTLFIFFILQIPTALSKNLASLCVLRFISGFFASPALATGGASVGDIISAPYMPVGIAAWCIACISGPSFGPFIGAVFAQLLGWRWTFWFMLIISGAAFIMLIFFLPETYGPTLLSRKARRLRAKTGNPNIVSQGEIENLKLTAKEIAIETLWRPMEISLLEPVVLLINLYISLVYSIMYIWFEAFPIVFIEVYEFNLIEMGVSYVALLVGALFGALFYIPLIYRRFTKKKLAGNDVPPEVFLPIAIIGSIFMPVGLFIFGWSATKSSNWMGPIIGTAIFACGAFIIFQTLFNYLTMSFGRYLASVFASNDLFRSIIAGAFPLFGAPLFNNTGSEKFRVGWGSSILGFICIGMIAIPVTFYLLGPKLRARSKYSGD